MYKSLRSGDDTYWELKETGQRLYDKLTSASSYSEQLAWKDKMNTLADQMHITYGLDNEAANDIIKSYHLDRTHP